MRLVLAVAVGMMAGPAAAQTVVDGSGSALPAGAIEKLPAIFRSALVDPTSAQISELKPAADGMFCGQVNAKNGMGGYAGARPFAMNLNTSEAFIYPTIIPGQALPAKEADAKIQSLQMLLKYCVKD